MSDDNNKPRPSRRNKPVGFRVSQEIYDKAQQRAKREKRSLGAILRAWLFFWSEDEAPSPPMMDGENVRAQKRKKKS